MATRLGKPFVATARVGGRRATLDGALSSDTVGLPQLPQPPLEVVESALDIVQFGE